MYKLISLLALFISITAVSQTVNIIPQPLSVKKGDGEFLISKNTVLVSDSENQSNAAYLQRMLKPAFAKNIKIESKGFEGIIFQIDQKLEKSLGKEGYKLEVGEKSIQIFGSSQTGIFYGIQTLLQMLPVDLEKNNGELSVPFVSIIDKPRFAWRSFMLDESRYFKGMEPVKKLMDQMAMLKMNVFHWHLTDDQGWRIEIKKYPKLTEIGSQRNDSQIGGWNSEKRSGKPHGGFYTQDEIKEIIEYAEVRQITIIPEIEMPGHASAAIAAYPWLGTIGELKEVPVIFGKLPDSYDVTKATTYEFIHEVLTEVMELFPSKIIHIGGDEVKFEAWKDSKEVQAFMKEKDLKSPADLQIYFTNKVSNFIDANDHRMMGWNEIMGGNVHEWQKAEDVEVKETLAKSAIIHFWKGNIDLVTEAVTNGYDIVNSHHVNSYLDYSYNNISIEKAYSFEPIPEGLDVKYHAKVLGSGCQMWGEWIPEVKDMDNKVFPRIAAYAEVGWTAKERKDYPVFRSNLNSILKRWDKLGINYADKFEDKDFAKKK
ncbi:MAG: beta-N-acetylhexosaminidase [Bacteroidetes bacterium]|nr:beta-N-acetylhexosaminidase [Bacteroidota bacterium]